MVTQYRLRDVCTIQLLPGFRWLTTVACDSDRERMMQSVWAVVGKGNLCDFPKTHASGPE